MNINELLTTNPVFVTSLVSSIVGLCSVLGAKELLAKMYDRYCSKADEKETDHKVLMDLVEKVDSIAEKLERMEEADKRSDINDVMMIGRQILDLQNRAIAKDKVSSACMPDYLEAYEHYMELAERTGCKVSERIKLNHARILEMVKEGKVVETLREWYK